VEGRALLEARGIPLPPARLCRTVEEAVAAAAGFDGPVALKVVSPEIPHKTEADGVALGIDGADADAVREAFHAIQDGARRYLGAERAEDAVAGILVTPMQPPPLVELLVGVSREGGMGPVLTLGSGGIWVDWIRDVGHRVLPVDRPQLLGLLEELTIGPILAGARGRPPAHIDGVLDLADRLGQLALHAPDIEEIEVNPLFVYPDRVVPVDVRVFLTPRAPGRAER
jgi:succinyl-CoA synthetase beta subunit